MINKKKECVESYDAKLGYLPLSREISVEDELSTCLWLKLGKGNWNEKRQFAIPVWLLMTGGNMITVIEGEADGLFLRYQHGGILEKRNVDLLKDEKWHQVCILWSTKTAAWSIYIDGKRDAYGTYNNFPGRGLGNLEIAKSRWRNKMFMTQFNLWNRVLNNQEIEAFSKSCNNGIGSLLSWADLYDGTKKSYIKPSSCKATPQAISTTVTPPPTTVRTTQAVTTKAPAKRKRGFSSKNGM